MSSKVAVVTGGNKGVGYAIVRGLCKQFDGDVILTARDEGRGKAAVAELEKEGTKPKFHQLDIDNLDSITALGDFLKQTYGGLDILVNNAAIAYKAASTAPFLEQAEVSMKTNYYGTRNVCDILFPLLRDHARVAHIASNGGTWSLRKCKQNIKDKVMGTETIGDVDQCMEDFVQAVREGGHQEKGWANSAYGTSKLGVIAMTPIQQAAFAPERDILINSCCPGSVKTDMSSGKGTKTIVEGADTPLYLSLLKPNCGSPRGEFVAERKVISWKTG